MLPMSKIDYDILEQDLLNIKDCLAIINMNISITVKGSVDDLDQIIPILQSLNIPWEQYHIHCDSALFAMMLQFIDNVPKLSFPKLIDSISVSRHKMMVYPIPCGITLSKKEHIKMAKRNINYLNSVDTTIKGSWNEQSVLYLWYYLQKKSLASI